MKPTIITLAFSNARASIANHRQYASLRGYRHIVIDASTTYTDSHARWLYKYETLLDHLSRAEPNEIVLMLTENAAIVEPVSLERVMEGKQWLLIRTSERMQQVDCQFWRNTPAMREAVLAIVQRCQFQLESSATEMNVLQELETSPEELEIDGHVVVGKASSLVLPDWIKKPTFLLSFSGSDALQSHGAVEARVSIRLRDALIEHIARCKANDVPYNTIPTCAPANRQKFSVYNPNRPIALVMLYTPEIAAAGNFSEDSFRRYCLRHGYTLYVYRDLPNGFDGTAKANWAKPYLLQRHFDSHEWLFWFDADIIVNNFGCKLETFTEGRDVVVARDVMSFLFNSGVMGFRRTAANRAALDEVADVVTSITDKSGVYASGGDQTHFCEIFRKRGLVRPDTPLSTFAINTNWPFARTDSFTIHYAGMINLYKAIMMQYDTLRAFT
jgi:hypothetical protein